jgi:hypothetical protein
LNHRKNPLSQGFNLNRLPGQQHGKPQPHQPSVAQPKMAAALAVKSQPVAPPVYRPQPVPKVLQTKSASAHQSQPNALPRTPVAPPVYRPEPKRIVQPKMATAAQAHKPPQAPPVYRPQPTPKVLQSKRVGSNGYQGAEHKAFVKATTTIQRTSAEQRARGSVNGQAASRGGNIKTNVAPQKSPQNFPSRKHLSSKTRSTVLQAKPTRPATLKDIESILARSGNAELREELLSVAQKLIQTNTLWFDDEIGASCAYSDEDKHEVKVVIPERVHAEWLSSDAQTERDAITIHELTHAAEMAANTGGDLSKAIGKDMDTDLVMLARTMNKLMDLIDEEREELESVPIVLASVPFKNLYLFMLERANYAYQLLTTSGPKSNREVPTVINQMIHVIDKKAPHLKTGTFYSWLATLQSLSMDSRKNRAFANRTR